MADWIETYATAMDITVWTSSTIESGATYDQHAHKWTVNVDRNGSKRTLHPSHLVFAGGFAGEPSLPEYVKDNNQFAGPTPHSEHFDSPKGWRGKHAVVIGSAQSAHGQSPAAAALTHADIASAFHRAGAASVTMVQRSPTYVLSSEHGLWPGLRGLYEENGPPVEDADLIFSSLPTNTTYDFNVQLTKITYQLDGPMLDGLEERGFQLERFPAGLLMKYFRDGSGYVLDVGSSKLIIDGRVSAPLSSLTVRHQGPERLGQEADQDWPRA